MNLQIRDPRAVELAEQLARERNITPEEAVIEALEAQVKRAETSGGEKAPLAERHAAFAARLDAIGKGDGHRMTKDEIDEMWGH